MNRIHINSRPRFYTDIIRGILTLHGYKDVDPRHVIAMLEEKGCQLGSLPYSALEKTVKSTAKEIQSFRAFSKDLIDLEGTARAMGL